MMVRDDDRQAQLMTGTDSYATLLLSATKQALQQRMVGEIATQTSPIVGLNLQVWHPIPESAVQYLQLIMRGTHRQALHEWLTTVQKYGYQAQAEVLAMLLRAFMHHQFEELHHTGAFKRLLGVQGMARAARLMHLDPVSYPDQAWWLTLLQRQTSDNDYQMLQKMQTATKFSTELTHDNVRRYMLYLKRINQVWTTPLTQHYLQTIHNTHEPSILMYFVKEIEAMAYFFALDGTLDRLRVLLQEYENDNLLVELRALPPYREYIRKAMNIITFRQHMVEAIRNGKQLGCDTY